MLISDYFKGSESMARLSIAYMRALQIGNENGGFEPESHLAPGPICFSNLLDHDCPSHTAWALAAAPARGNPLSGWQLTLFSMANTSSCAPSLPVHPVSHLQGGVAATSSRTPSLKHQALPFLCLGCHASSFRQSWVCSLGPPLTHRRGHLKANNLTSPASHFLV